MKQKMQLSNSRIMEKKKKPSKFGLNRGCPFNLINVHLSLKLVLALNHIQFVSFFPVYFLCTLLILAMHMFIDQTLQSNTTLTIHMSALYLCRRCISNIYMHSSVLVKHKR